LYLGFSPVWVLGIRLFLNIVTAVWRAIFLRGLIKLPLMKFCFHVLLPIGIITVVAGCITEYVHITVPGVKGFFVSCVVSMICTTTMVYFVGLQKSERAALRKLAADRIKKRGV